MQFQAVCQGEDDEQDIELFDEIVRAGPWQLAALDGLLARNPRPFSAILVRDRGSALERVRSRLEDEGASIAIIGYSEVIDAGAVVDALHAGAIDYIAWPPDAATFAYRLRIAAGRAARKLSNRDTARMPMIACSRSPNARARFYAA